MSAMEKGTADIRRMGRGDIDAVLAIDRKISGGRGLITYKDMVAAAPGEGLDLSFVAEIDGQVVGFILARLTYVGVPFIEIAVVQAIVVDPDYQRRGIATKLVHALLGYCKTEEVKVNTIRVALDEHNDRLRRFFARLGFRRSGLVIYARTFES
ncbi:MAG: GNAT family N-acetyltransferase [Chloroflexota bacterium]